MKRTFLFAAITLAGLGARAQCIPDPLYADSVFGVWPDTTENFVDGVEGIFYSDTLNLIVPTNAQDIDPGFPAVSIDSVQLTTVAGLPPGLNTFCNSQTGGACTYLPEILGCGLIEGTPTAAGSYPITLTVTAWFNVLGSPVPFPQDFTGYEITIAPSTGVMEPAGTGLSGVFNTPNPFAGRTTIEFDLKRPSDVRITVFNLVGEEIARQQHNGSAGHNKVAFDGGQLEEGIYIYHVQAGARSFTGRMVLHR